MNNNKNKQNVARESHNIRLRDSQAANHCAFSG